MYFYSGDNGNHHDDEDEDLFGFGTGRQPDDVPPPQPPQPRGGWQPPAPPQGYYYGAVPPAPAPKSYRGLKILCIVLTVLVIISNVVTIIVASYLSTNRPKETTNDVNELARVLAANNVNSVALITTVGTKNGVAVSSKGSGFVVYYKLGTAYVATNYHVVEYAMSADALRQTGTVSMTVAGMNYAGCKVVTALPRRDLAVVQITGALIELPAVRFADSDKAEFGQFVLAIGNPYGDGLAVSFGVVSMPAATVEMGGEYNIAYEAVRTDAAINPGNSGGPLLDKDGRVLGMNAAKKKRPAGEEVEPEGMGYAITSKTVIDFINGSSLPFRVGVDGAAYAA